MYMYYNPAATNTYAEYSPHAALVGWSGGDLSPSATDTINDSAAPQTCAPFISAVFQRRQCFVRANGRGEAVASKPNGRPATKPRKDQSKHNCCAFIIILHC